MPIALALCAVGAEKVLSNELRKLDLRPVSSAPGRVRFEADLAGLYRSLMASRVADRIMLETASFRAANFDDLFEGVRSVRWAELIPRGRSIVIDKVRTFKSTLSSPVAIQSVAHKAVAQVLCDAWRIRRLPEEPGAAEIRIYLDQDQASVCLDISGEPLFRRGYRVESVAAPLRETTAAALLLLMGWKRKIPLMDPLCGSGTIAIEAALYAWDAAPGLGRLFALSKLRIGNRALEDEIRSSLAAKVNLTNIIRIEGSDIDPKAVSAAQANALRAFAMATGKAKAYKGRGDQNLDWTVPEELKAALPSFSRRDFADSKPSAEGGLILTNPPYGERLGDHSEAEATYQAMGSLASAFKGWSMGIITNHAGFESHFGYVADSVREITNGALRSYLYRYDELGRRRDGDSSRTR